MGPAMKLWCDHPSPAKFNSHLETSTRPFQRNKVIMYRYEVDALQRFQIGME